MMAQAHMEATVRIRLRPVGTEPHGLNRSDILVVCSRGFRYGTVSLRKLDELLGAMESERSNARQILAVMPAGIGGRDYTWEPMSYERLAPHGTRALLVEEVTGPKSLIAQVVSIDSLPNGKEKNA